MNLSFKLCLPLMALAALAVDDGNVYAGDAKGAANLTPAAATVNNSKSNTFKTVNSQPKAVQDCKVQGGTIGKDPKGQPACITYSANKPSSCSQWIGDICVIWRH